MSDTGRPTSCELASCLVPSLVDELVAVVVDPDLGAVPCQKPAIELNHRDKVVVELDEGVFLGTVSLFVPPVVREREGVGKIVRVATEEDIGRWEVLEEQQEEALKFLRQRAWELGVAMRPIKVRFPLEGRKAVVYFLSEGRVDFRSLVRDAARRYRRRFEMRHVGVRDAAKVMGGLGPCGRCLCCTSFMGYFYSVTVRMAKAQNLSLNPAKISGMCGRLMCCLAHEVDSYATQTGTEFAEVNG